MKYSTIPRVRARRRRDRNPWIVGNDLGPVPRERRAVAEPEKVIKPCAYCRSAPGLTQDHVVPKSYRKKGLVIPASLALTVACCKECNWRKATRRFVPASLEFLIPMLTETFPGSPWLVWDGNPLSPVFLEANV